MFKRKKQSINPSTTDSLIGEGTVYEGKMKSEASIRIEGRFTGDIECKGDVTVGESGDVNSNIAARDVIVAGSVKGNVMVTGKLTIISTGRLFGNINAASFIIEEGGTFQGTSKMGEKAEPSNENSIPESAEKSAAATLGENTVML